MVERHIRKQLVMSLMIIGLVILALVGISFANNSQNMTVKEFQISTEEGDELSVGAAYSGTNFLAAWGVVLTCDGQYIFARIVSKEGSPVADTRTGLDCGGLVHAAYDGSNYLLVWLEETPTILGQFITPTGVKLGKTFVVSQKAQHMFSDIAFGENAFLVTYDDRSNVYGSFVSKSSAISPGEPIQTVQIAQGQEPSAAYGDGKFLVVWHDGRNNVYGKFIYEAGNSIGDTIAISQTSYPSDNPTAVAFGGDRFLVLWHEEIGGQQDLYSRFVSSDGKPLGSEFAVANSTANERFPQAVFDGERFLVGWVEDFGKETAAIKGRFVSSDGTLGEQSTIAEKTSAGIPFYGSNIVFGGDRFFMTVTRGQGLQQLNFEGAPSIVTKGDIYGIFVIPPKPAVDSVPPSTTASAIDDVGKSYVLGILRQLQYINITLSCDDGGGSGCKNIQYCVDADNSCVPSTTYTAPFTAGAEGTSYIRYQSTDSAGNIETAQSRTIRIDNTAPSVVINSPESNSVLTSRDIAVSITVSDANLNNTEVRISKDGRVVDSKKFYESGTSTVRFDVPDDGRYEITATAYDDVLNGGSTKVTNIDVTTVCREALAQCLKDIQCCSGKCENGICTAAVIQPPSTQPKQDNTILFIAIIAAVLIAVGVVAFLLMRKGKPTASQTQTSPK